MSEEEYWAGEPEDDYDDEEETLGVFMIEEPDDLTLVMLPKIEFDRDEVIEEYVKAARKCKNKDQLRFVFNRFFEHISGTVSLLNDVQHLQDRAKELEFNIQMLQQEYGSY